MAIAVSEIKEGACYVRDDEPGYFRRVEFIVDVPDRPGGKVVAWSTDGFAVRRGNGDHSGKTRGKCGIATFAQWASRRLEEA